MTPDQPRPISPIGPPAASLVGDAPTRTGDSSTADGDAARAVRGLATDTPNGTAGPPPLSAADAPPGFVIEWELGRGGMGVGHRGEAAGAEKQKSWFPAGFHLHRLAAADPADPDLARRLAAAKKGLAAAQ